MMELEGGASWTASLKMWWLLVMAALATVLVLWMGIPGLVWGFVRELAAARKVSGHPWPRHWLYVDQPNLSPTEQSMLTMQRNVQSNPGAKMFKIWLGHAYVYYALHHPAVIKKAIKTSKNNVTYDLLRPWIGDGLLVSKGKKWHRNRHLLTPAFHYQILNPYVSVYNSCVAVLLEKWAGQAEMGKPAKVFSDVGLLSLDVVLQCAFSYRSDCQDVGAGQEYVRAVHAMTKHIVDRSLSLFSYVEWLYWHTPAGKEMAKCCKVVHDHSEKVIRDRRAELGLLGGNEGGPEVLAKEQTESVIRERKQALGIDGGSKEERESVLKRASSQRKYIDFLDILLTAQDEDGRGMTDLEIRDEADTFMFEGHDTTTSGMSWTFYCLAQHPEHQDKIREEVRNILMGREWLEYDDLKELKYTTWCIKEAMRLYPPVIEVYRRLNEDTRLDGVLLPKGSKLAISIYNLHHNPAVWEEPDVFNPLRFHPSNLEGRDPYAYMPFSAGYRNCIGQNFALNEMKVTIATVCHRFQFSLWSGHRVELLPTMILRAKNDILLHIEKA